VNDQQHSGADEPVRPASSDSPSGDAAAATATADSDTLRRERDEYYDLLLRKTAEFDNYRRRIERERRELSDYAAAELLKDILPLVDDLERALASTSGDAPSSATALRSGVELILRQLLDLLKRRGVTMIEAKGADFDPHVHESVTQEVSADHREGEVLEEFRRGYKLGDRLLRPAMVKVATRG
jgi:molecular chaperone GrpE